MAIDFTKPIQYIADLSKEVKILFHDEHSVLVEFEDNLRSPTENRYIYTFDKFNLFFENVSKEPRKIKGFIGLSTSKETVTVYCTSVVYESKEKLLKCCGGYTTIVEINATEGEGLQ